VIQAILRHSNVAVTRDSYIIRDAVDPQSQAAMQALETRLCNYNALRSLDVRINSSQNVQNKVVPPSGEMAEWLKAAVC
jgi:thiamine biosynthesis lipoprotein ApbE